MQKKVLLVLLVFCFGLWFNIYAETKIDVEKKIREDINKDPSLKEKIIEKLFNVKVNGNYYTLKSFKITKMTQISHPKIDFSSPKFKKNMEWELLDAHEAWNCTGDPSDYTFEFSQIKTSSITVRNDISLSYSLSASVGINIEFVNANVTQSLGTNFFNSKSKTVVNTTTLTKTQHVSLNEVGGRYYEFKVKVWKGTIPFEAKFKIDDTSKVSLEFEGKNNGSFTIFEHVNYKGMNQTFNNIGSNGLSIPKLSEYKFNNKLSSIKVNGPLEIHLYTRKNFRGKEKVIKGNIRWIGDEFNDKISSIKVFKKNYIKKDFLFNLIKDDIPNSIKIFTATGVLKVDEITSKPYTGTTINFMDEEEFNKLCGSSNKVTSTQGSANAFKGKSGHRRLSPKKIKELIKKGKIKIKNYNKL